MNPIKLNSSIFKLLPQLWGHLNSRRKHQFLLLLGLMVVSAFFEVVSLGAVLPFIGILISPERVFNHPVVYNLAQGVGITSAHQLMLPLTVVFSFAALAAGGVRMFLMWANTRFAYAVGSDLSIEVYRRTLYQPYWIHVARNSSEVISAITTKVNDIVFQLLMPLLILFSSALLMFSITGVLIVIKPIVALVVTGGFGASYGLVTWLSRRQVRRNSQTIAYEQTQVVKALQEGLGGIRDVLLDGTQPAYCNIYRDADLSLRRAQAGNSYVAATPRYLMEAMGMVLIAVIALALTNQSGGASSALPVLAALAMGAQRILPALQQSYTSWITVAGSQATVADILDLLNQKLSDDVLNPVPIPLLFKSAIRFDAVCFRYSNEGPLVLDGLDLVIPKGARVGFVGSTGSGKTTTLDLLMGLLLPTDGRLLVDEQHVMGKNIRSWQQNIAHVPQSIYLADATIAGNIAFGVPIQEIDMDLVKKAARQAHIAEFIESRPNCYDAFVGERGIRLSGGQRQRIGIARALYKQASVLVFDEATSALDNATEKSVMSAIDSLNQNRDLTILIIAHRLTTVRKCDLIVEMEKGRVVAQGTYEELMRSSTTFRSLATFAD